MQTENAKSSRALRSTKEREKDRLSRDARQHAERNNSHPDMVSSNIEAAQSIWGPLPRPVLKNLRELTQKHHLSVVGGVLRSWAANCT